EVVPLDATLVKGSHGRRPANSSDYPLLLSPEPTLLSNSQIEATDVYHVLKRHLLGSMKSQNPNPKISTPDKSRAGKIPNSRIPDSNSAVMSWFWSLGFGVFLGCGSGDFLAASPRRPV